MNIPNLFVISLMLAGAPTAANAGDTKVLAQEPGPGKLGSGETVLVDDGTCPPGQLKQVVGGSDRSIKTEIRKPGTPRQVSCVRR